MRRDIKFRVWHQQLNKMLDHDWLTSAGVLYKAINEPGEGQIVMQFTGLKDNKGNEIYEGDIIKWDYEYDVGYDGDMPIVKRSSGAQAIKDIFDRSRILEASSEGGTVEVIGNIYEP